MANDLGATRAPCRWCGSTEHDDSFHVPKSAGTVRTTPPKNGKGCLVLVVLVLVAIVALVVWLVGKNTTAKSGYTITDDNGGGSSTFTPAAFGSAWNLKTDHVILGCTLVYPPSTDIVELTMNIDGTLYALNGTALDDPAHLGAIEPPASVFVGDKFYVGAMQDKARTLC